MIFHVGLNLNLFKTYTYLPYEKNKKNLDELLDYNEYTRIYELFQPCLKLINKDLEKKYFFDKFLYQQTELELLQDNTIIFNLLIKALELQKATESVEGKVLLECNSEEVNYYELGLNGVECNRFANLYALIASEIPELFEIKIKEKKIDEVFIDSSSKSIILKYINYKGSMLFSNLLKKFNLIKYNKNVLIIKNNALIKEIESELNLNNVKTDIIYKEFDSVFKNELFSKKLTGKFYKDIYNILESNLFEMCKTDLKIEDEFIVSYLKTLSNLISHHIEYLFLLQAPMRNKATELLKKYNSSYVLTNGLFGAYGLSVADALMFNKCKITSVEHGLTAGNNIDYDAFLPISEGRTSSEILTYTKAATKLRAGYSNNNSKVFTIGAPDEEKSIKLKWIQKLINKKKFGLKFNDKVIFYVSHNLMLNVPKYYPVTKPNSIIYEDEIFLLSEVLNKVNKKVIYKDYPTKQYIDFANVDLTFLKNIQKIDSQEDFRYMRSVSDIIITQGSESTLAWCIGVDVPFIFLDSDDYEPLASEEVKKAFSESFFVFNYDEEGWQEKLIQFLNQPYSNILKLWEEKKVFREKYDEMYFLSHNLNAGKIGADHILNNLNEVDGV